MGLWGAGSRLIGAVGWEVGFIPGMPVSSCLDGPSVYQVGVWVLGPAFCSFGGRLIRGCCSQRHSGYGCLVPGQLVAQDCQAYFYSCQEGPDCDGRDEPCDGYQCSGNHSQVALVILDVLDCLEEAGSFFLGGVAGLRTRLGGLPVRSPEFRSK